MKNRVNIRKRMAALKAQTFGGIALFLACNGVSASLNCEHPRDPIETPLCSYTWKETGCIGDKPVALIGTRKANQSLLI